MRSYSADSLMALVRAFCAAGGSDEREADLVARNLVDSNLVGHDSHGIGILPVYAASMADGWLKPNGHIARPAARAAYCGSTATSPTAR